MTYLLVSVTTPRQAETALDAGADIISLCAPECMADAPLPLGLVTETVTLVARRRPVCGHVGEARSAAELARRAAVLADTGVDYLKIPLDTEARACIAALAPLADRTALLGVLHADRQPNITLINDLAAAGFAGVMLDTADKSAGSLRRHVADAGISRFLGRAAMQGLLAGLAGSLAVEDLPPLLAMGPDFLGFHRAVRRNDSGHEDLDRSAVARLRQAIPRHGEIEPVAHSQAVYSAGSRIPS